MDNEVEFQDEDSTDPILQRDLTQVSKPLLPSALMYFHIVKNEKQANLVLAGISMVIMTLSVSVIVQAFVPEKNQGELDKYPAQDISKGF